MLSVSILGASKRSLAKTAVETAHRKAGKVILATNPIFPRCADVTRLAQIETEIINSYNSVSGVNYTDDSAFYDEIKNVALPAAKRLTSEANSVYNKLSSEEIKKAHSIYLDACNVYYEALEGMLEGVEKQDVTTIRKASEKLEQISELAIDYQNAIKQLAEKYGLEWQSIEQFIQL